MYLSNEMEGFCYKGGVVFCRHSFIEMFKVELTWATSKRLWVISNVMLFKTVIPLRNYVKSKAFLG